MDENLQNQVGNENVETTATTQVTEAQNVTSEKPERTYTKAEVQDLMRRRVDRSHKAFFTRYGVENLNGLDDLMRKSQKFGDDYAAMQLKNSDLVRENAFLKNNIRPDKYEDIVTYFKGANIEFSEEQLIEALKTHHEWLKVQEDKKPPTTTITKMGSEAHAHSTPSEKERAEKLLGVRF